MATHFVEATGLRVISMYVQEYFHWGWQPYNQENDDGIDGEIIPRTPSGQDMGVRIKVQSKSGQGYLSSEDEEEIRIQPYSNKTRLKKHIDNWKQSREPVILVYTNATKNNKSGANYLDLKHPVAWWVRMDKYPHPYDDTTIVRIPRTNLFQEHTKGALLNLIKDIVNDWSNCEEVAIDRADLKIWNTWHNAKEDAKPFYEQWKASNPKIYYRGKEFPLIVSRTGWRHITNGRRKDRVALSLKLLPIALKILAQSNNIRPVVLRSNYPSTSWESRITHLGYRAIVEIEGIRRKVQVVVKRYQNVTYGKEKWWFYSVHIVK